MIRRRDGSGRWWEAAGRTRESGESKVKENGGRREGRGGGCERLNKLGHLFITVFWVYSGIKKNDFWMWPVHLFSPPPPGPSPFPLTSPPIHFPPTLKVIKLRIMGFQGLLGELGSPKESSPHLFKLIRLKRGIKSSGNRNNFNGNRPTASIFSFSQTRVAPPTYRWSNC